MQEELLKYMNGPNMEEPEKFLKGLPPKTLGRVRALQGLEEDHSEMRVQFEAELHKLKVKYAELYKPLYDARKQMVIGKYEVTPEQMKEGKEYMEAKMIDSEDEDEDDDPPPVDIEMKVTEKVKEGVPEFWLTSLENHPLMKEMVEECDRPILAKLTDLVLEEDDGGFRLIFHFAENDYFTNETLIKTYHTEIDNGDYEVTDILGDEIEWKEGKNVTVKIEKKKQKSGKTIRMVTKTKKQDSFFTFFDSSNEMSDEDETEKKMEEFHIGCAIKDTLIPHAVEWYCNELYETDDEEEEEEEDFEDDDDEEEDAAPKKKGKGKKSEQNPECKQQ
eukprot:TRINITY_DN810_c0_g2_i1.p1 TRINITY_DN810_c0_g2~~TRINITY_DN810_c0_g2_i1.p1  ORF type:complete len:352 (+),score=134.76 TRINITY_DN810_c0_g2_i1:62-1057(+)